MNNKSTVELNNYIVYAHINKSNGKLYIGITCQPPEHRWGRNGARYKGCDRFYKAISHYGWNNFNHEIWKRNLSFGQACYWEQFYISRYHTNDGDHGYNLTAGGQTYAIHSEETKQKMSLSASGSGNSQYGKPHSSEHKQKITESLKKTASNRTADKYLSDCKGHSTCAIKCTELDMTFESLSEAIHYIHPDMTVGSSEFKKRVTALGDRLKPGRNGIYKKLHFVRIPKKSNDVI